MSPGATLMLCYARRPRHQHAARARRREGGERGRRARQAARDAEARLRAAGVGPRRECVSVCPCAAVCGQRGGTTPHRTQSNPRAAGPRTTFGAPVCRIVQCARRGRGESCDILCAVIGSLDFGRFGRGIRRSVTSLNTRFGCTCADARLFKYLERHGFGFGTVLAVSSRLFRFRLTRH